MHISEFESNRSNCDLCTLCFSAQIFASLFCTLTPLVAALPSHPSPPAYGHPAPPPYGHPAPPPAYGHPQPAYGYEEPKQNCTVEDVREIAEICTPSFETVCENIYLPIKIVVDREFCYDVTRTVCTETIQEVPNEVCSYTYNKKATDTTASTIAVSFKKESKVQMVTVCTPTYGGYGHGGYGQPNKYCNEVAQTTQYNVPVVTPEVVPVTVSYPEPVKTCVNKPIYLPRVSCANNVEKKCITVPDVSESRQSVEKCETKLAAPACQKVELTLPKQVCIDLVYGYAEDHHEHPQPYAAKA